MASNVVSLIGSAMPRRPAARPLTARNMTVWPSACRLSARAFSGLDVHAVRRHQGGGAEDGLAALDAADDAHARDGLELAGCSERSRPRSLGRRHQGRGQRMLAAAFQAGRQVQDLGVGHSRGGGDRDQSRPALGQRAGLVDDERVDLFEDLQGLGVLDEDAGRGPAAHAHHDRHRRGQAQAHGHATMSTATATSRAEARRGSGPTTAHTMNAAAAMTTTAGTNHAATRSASRWMGARLRWASCTRRTMCASIVSAADAVGPHDDAAGAVDGAAGDAVAGRLGRGRSVRR